ncbi:MAG: hypothetical protein FK734_05850 [Asgard group archaeon]|nr:hypothetical protein [Asgard group archaeon]
MSNYILKTYEKGVEEEQAKLGTEVTKDWKNFGQTNAENLKQTYSRPEFDPETRHYAYKDGELVGFLVSRVLPDQEDGIKRAQHDFPLVKEGHEKAAELLYEKAMETLKEKGVKIVESRVAKDWLGTKEQADKYGYKESRLNYLIMIAKLENIKTKESEAAYENFDPERDKEEIIQIFKDQFNMTEEQAEANFDGIINPPEGFYAQPILREDGKIVSRGLLFVPADPKTAIIRHLTPDPKKHFDSYLETISNIAKEKGSEEFQLGIFGPAVANIDFYKEHGFAIESEFYIYEKEI